MEIKKLFLAIGMFSFLFLFTKCSEDTLILDESEVLNKTTTELSFKGKIVTEESFGNNLSFPVIWSDGATKSLRGTLEQYQIDGVWYGVWGEDPIDPQADLFSCGPYISGATPCDEAEYKAFIQKDEFNVWQASNWIEEENVVIDFIDWGDNLESVDWYTKSQVRVEVVLYKDLIEQVTQYPMRHASGWGTDEIHGLQTTMDNTIVSDATLGYQATVYSHNARFTIQKINVDNLDHLAGNLKWRNKEGWIEVEGYNEDLINDSPLFNNPAYEGKDGPTNFGAEVNVKGKIIYGFTWNVRNLNEGEGYYRLTFSFDNGDSGYPLNTFFENGVTEILVTEEAPEVTLDSTESGEDSGGGTPVIYYQQESGNTIYVTYMDVLIKARGTGQGGGKSGGGAGSGSGIDGNHGYGTGTSGGGRN